MKPIPGLGVLRLISKPGIVPTMQSIAALLVKHDVVKVNFDQPFTWTSGIKSPIYCDCRELTGLVEARATVVTTMIEKINELGLKPDAVAGTATAGISWAAWVAGILNVPMGYVRGKPKGHGAGKMVEGLNKNLGSKPQIVVVEDAFSTGGSSIKSAEALRSELNAEVKYIFGIFSWDTPKFFASQRQAGLEMISFTNFDEIVSALQAAGKISPTQAQSLQRFHEDPPNWHEREQSGAHETEPQLF